MKYFLTFCWSLMISLTLFQGVFAQQDKAVYVPKVDYPLFKVIKNWSDSVKAARDSLTADIQKKQKTAKEFKDSTEMQLRFDISRIVKPTSPDNFNSVFHFPPTPQDASSTCWAFSGTSYFESEIFRLTGKKIKLSEMYTVYFEYIEKVRRYIHERGESSVSPGSEDNALIHIFSQYGAVPRSVYDGLNPVFPYYNHDLLDSEIQNYLNYVKANNVWDEESVIESLRVILNKYLGKPPDMFTFENKQYSPKQFFTEVLTLNPNDYMMAMSTLKIPFYTKGLFDVPDNWWRDSNYYNLPLDAWYAVIKDAITMGYSVSIGGGTSEPGYYGIENIGVIPDFDIPRSFINQDSREYRIYRATTGDDHGLHLVGYLNKGNRDWFLIKDSGSGSRRGNKSKGYFFFRDDYVRLKMLTIMVHKDIMQKHIEPKKRK